MSLPHRLFLAITVVAALVAALSVPAQTPAAASWPEVAPEARVWNTYPLDQVVHKKWVGPAVPLHAVRIVAPIGGTSTGQVVVTQSGGVKGLKVTVKPPEGWPADSVTARFQAMNDEKVPAWQWGPGQVLRVKIHDQPGFLPSYLPRLTDTPPTAPVVPIRVIANVPRTAAAGNYKAALTVVLGSTTQRVPISIEAGPFVMPEPGKTLAHLDIYQFPESVARQYKVAMWSPEHWQLVEKSLRLVGQYPSHVAWIPILSGRMNGLSESMLRYRKTAAGWEVDASRATKYLDLVGRYSGEPRSLMCFAWSGYADATRSTPARRRGIGMDVHSVRGTEADLPGCDFPVTGFDGKDIFVPTFSAEAKSLYKATFDAIRADVKKRGWKQDCVQIGLGMDVIPSKFFVDMLKEPSGNAMWVKHSHDQSRDFHGVRVAYSATARGQADWGGPFYRNPRMITDYPYDEGPSSGLMRMHSAVNNSLRGKMVGIAGPMADFWGGVLWVGGQPTMQSYGQYIFYPGPKGAEHSVQSLILLQAAQAAEAAWRCAAAGDKAADAWLYWGHGNTVRADWVGQEKALKPELLPDIEAALFKAAAGK